MRSAVYVSISTSSSSFSSSRAASSSCSGRTSNSYVMPGHDASGGTAAGGGTRVARMVGARAIDPDTRDPEERKLRNIVEEMSIASGVPVPELYVMDHETGINAFVAGYTPGEAVMVVTHGALTQLNRDELQGVVGHEFSHILNGDMRINVRLIALLAGILMIGQIGQFLLRAGFYSSGRSRNRDGRAQAAMGLICAGIDGDIALPSAQTAPWLVLIGAAGLLAHFCLTTALSLAPATVVVPIDFTRLPLIAVIASEIAFRVATAAARAATCSTSSGGQTWSMPAHGIGCLAP